MLECRMLELEVGSLYKRLSIWCALQALMFVNGILLLNHTNKIVIIATGSSTWSVENSSWRLFVKWYNISQFEILKLMLSLFTYAVLFCMTRQPMRA